MFELKEMQIIQLQAQAEIYERSQADNAIIFEALAAIYEKKIGAENNG